MIGVSTDLTDKNDEFRAECGLDFPLVSDEGGALTEELDLLKEYGDTGRSRGGSPTCSTRTAIVQRVWDVTDVGEHPEEVLAAVTG